MGGGEGSGRRSWPHFFFGLPLPPFLPLSLPLPLPPLLGPWSLEFLASGVSQSMRLWLPPHAEHLWLRPDGHGPEGLQVPLFQLVQVSLVV